jgi:hypothetical protein
MEKQDGVDCPGVPNIVTRVLMRERERHDCQRKMTEAEVREER